MVIVTSPTEKSNVGVAAVVKAIDTIMLAIHCPGIHLPPVFANSRDRLVEKTALALLARLSKRCAVAADMIAA